MTTRWQASGYGNTEIGSRDGKADTEEIHLFSKPSSLPHDFEIIDLARLRGAYSLLLARLKLLQNNHSWESLRRIQDPPELIAILAQSNMFDMAFSLCVSHHSDPRIVFEILATKCSQLSMMRTTSTPSYQEQTALEILRHVTDVDDLYSTNPVDRVWALLRYYLEKGFPSMDPTTSIELRRHVIDRLLSLNRHIQLPCWLTEPFKGGDKELAESGESRPIDLLLHSYLKHDLIEEACALLISYMEQICRHIIAVNRPKPCMIWLPYTAIDQLLKELEERSESNSILETSSNLPKLLLGRLKTCLDTYFRHVNQLSDRCRQTATFQHSDTISIL